MVLVWIGFLLHFARFLAETLCHAIDTRQCPVTLPVLCFVLVSLLLLEPLSARASFPLFQAVLALWVTHHAVARASFGQSLSPNVQCCPVISIFNHFHPLFCVCALFLVTYMCAWCWFFAKSLALHMYVPGPTRAVVTVSTASAIALAVRGTFPVRIRSDWRAHTNLKTH